MQIRKLFVQKNKKVDIFIIFLVKWLYHMLFIQFQIFDNKGPSPWNSRHKYLIFRVKELQ